MGLDMYLSGQVTTYRTYGEKKPDPLRAACEAAALAAGIGASDNIDTITVEREVAYWRKANAIHAWFVANVQGGVDECQRSHVGREQLVELRDLCAALAESSDESVAKAKLPPQAGFFFGSTDIDEGYWDDIADTVNQLNRVLALPESVEFYYRASW